MPFNILIYFSFVYFLPICCHYKAKKKLLMNFSLIYNKFWALAYTNKSVSVRKHAYQLILFFQNFKYIFSKIIIWFHNLYLFILLFINFFKFVRGCIRFWWIQIHFYWCQQSCVPDTAIHVTTFYWTTNS